MYNISTTLLLYTPHTLYTMMFCEINHVCFTTESVHCYTSTAHHQSKACLFTALNQLICLDIVCDHRVKFAINVSIQNWSLIVIIVNEHVHIYPICDKKFHTIPIFSRKLQFIETNTLMCSRLYNKNIFAFDHIDGDSKFLGAWKIHEKAMTSQWSNLRVLLSVTLLSTNLIVPSMT